MTLIRKHPWATFIITIVIVGVLLSSVAYAIASSYSRTTIASGHGAVNDDTGALLVDLSSGTATLGSVSVTGTPSFSIIGGTLASANVNVSVTGGTFSVANVSSGTLDKITSLTGGTLGQLTSGTLGSVTVTAGTLGSVTLAGTPSVSLTGTPSMALTGTSNIAGTVSVTGTPSIAGTVAVSGGTLSSIAAPSGYATFGTGSLTFTGSDASTLNLSGTASTSVPCSVIVLSCTSAGCLVSSSSATGTLPLPANQPLRLPVANVNSVWITGGSANTVGYGYFR